jgi:DNA polymerase III delta prime subunit
MSRGPQEKNQLPPGWWDRLRQDYLAAGFSSMEDFCGKPPGISLRTLRNARLDELMTERSLDLIAKKLSIASREEMLQLWSRPLAERLPLFLVPRLPNKFFTGREELLASIASKFKENTTLRTVVLSGPPGIGKTETALVFASRDRMNYRDVFWFTCDTSSILLAQYCELAVLLRLKQKADAKQEFIRNAVRLWLDQHSGWLLIFDNVDNFAVLSEYLPRVPGGDVIITTRHDMQDSYHLGPLSPAEARDLLMSRSGKQVDIQPDRECAEVLATELGYYPLALEQAGAFILATGATFGAYIDAFRKAPIDVLEEDAGLGAGIGTTVARTWQLTMTQLSESARRLLSMASLCAPDAVPLELLAESYSLRDARPLAFEMAIRDLRRFSLVTLKSAPARLSIHRLLKKMAFATADRQDVLELLDSVMDTMAGLLPGTPNSDWAVFERLSRA